MYKMKADGVVFYDPSADDMTLQVLSPKVLYELNKAGSLTFTVLPGNVMYDGLHKLKTVITLERDGEIVFRGRVLETATDLYNQKEVYCEGELAFLLDSIVRPYEYKGKASDLFRQLLTKHNEQVEEYKRFEIGIITAVTDTDELETEGGGYADTMSEIKSLLLDGFGGYLRVRRENGVRYLDYVDAFNQTCTQEINFGVNLVDIENKVNAQDVFTVLVPLGSDGVTIETVNGGKDYIENPEAIAQYGRIVKTHTWDNVDNPAFLLEAGREYMAKMAAETTLTIRAVDLHDCGVDTDSIHLGDTVKLHSVPHGMDKRDVCTAIDQDIENPEKTEYTFGFPRETLTESHARSIKGLSRTLSHQHRWLTETDKALNINVEAVNLIGHRTTQLEIDVNAAEEAITLKASQDSVDILEEKHNEVVLRLDAAEGTLIAQAKQINLKADLTVLEGYVKMEDFEAVEGWTDFFASARVETIWLEGGTVNADTVLTPKIEADVADVDVAEIGEAIVGSLTIDGKTAATQEWVEELGYVVADDVRNYCTNMGFITAGYLTSNQYTTATDVRNYCTNMGFITADSLEKKTQYVVTNVEKTMNSAGYVTNVTFSGVDITYYA